ncbi:hypothetical protein VKT23_019894 [Stygiomarasmius scandens]|uniref:Uncharacterized protein n=1 Tax=Marasmiellus scandens TaxID=2682957 RepID=A0ABR1INE1_9AGAR
MLEGSSTPIVHADSLTADGRHVKRSCIQVEEPPSPVKRFCETPRTENDIQLTDYIFGDTYESILAKIYDDNDLAAAVDRGNSNIVLVEEMKSRHRYFSLVHQKV